MRASFRSKEESFKKLIVYLQLISSVGILSAGILFFRSEKQNLQHEKQHELQSIANLKIGQISEWYRDETYDAEKLSENIILIGFIENWVKNGDPINRDLLYKFLSSLCIEHDYEYILLTDISGRILLSNNDSIKQSNSVQTNTIQKALISKEVASTDLYWCQTQQKITIDFICQVGSKDDEAMLFLIFRKDPVKFLFPLVQSWPASSKTAETIIFEEENDSLLYLNDLRYRSNTALKLKISLTKTEMPAVNALRGFTGVTEGIDYRGKRTISFVSPVPETPWFMEAKIDKGELLSDLFRNASIIFGFTILIILLLFILIAYLYRNRERNVYRELILAQEEFSITLSSIGEGVITTDVNCKLQYLNPRAEQLSGWKIKDARDKPFEKVFYIIDEGTHEKIVCPAKEILKTGTSLTLTGNNLLVDRNSREIPITCNGSPIIGNNGEIVGAVLILHDQSYEHMVNLQLQKEKSKSQHYLDVAGVMIVALDREGKINMINKKGCSLLGSDEINLIGKNWFETALPPDQQEYAEGIFRRCIEGDLGSAEYYESFVITKMGELRIIAWHNALLYDEDGQISGTLSSGEDITDRTRAEEALVKEKHLSESLIETIPDNIYFKDLNSCFIQINKNMAKAFGLNAPEEATGKSDFDFFEKEHAEQAFHDEQQIVKTGEAIIGKEEKENWLSGDTTWAHSTKVPMYDATGKVTGIMGISRDITKLKLAEKALRDSEERYKLVSDLTSDYIYRGDIDELGNLQIGFLSDSFTTITGRRLEEVKSMDSWNAIFYQGDLDSIRQFIANLITSRQKGEIECRTYLKDGVQRWVNILAQPLIDAESDKVISVIGSVKDITERKIAEEALRESEEKYRILLDESTDPIFSFDHAGRYLYVNRAFATGVEKSIDQIQDKKIWDVFPRDEADKRYAAVETVFQTGHEKVIEVKVPRSDGDRYFITTISPIKDEKSNVLSVICSSKDITERKQAEIILKESEEKFRIAFDNAPSGMSIIKANGQFLAVNPMLCNMFGYSEEELLDGKLQDITHPDDVERSDQWIRKKIAGDTSEPEFEKRYIHKKGNVVWGLVRSQWIRNNDESPRMAIAHIADITERKRAEEILIKQKTEIEKQNEEYASLNAEYLSLNEELRTSNEELAAARDKAQESDRLKSAFLANMSHEIRTPMNAIIGFSDLLNNPEISSDKQQQFTQSIRQRSYDLLALINDILDLSKIEAGQMSLYEEGCNLHDLLSEIQSTFKTIWNDSGKSHVILTVENHLTPKGSRIVTDTGRLRQILSNLIGNAFKFTTKGSISLICKKAGSNKLQFNVQDTGIGITTEKQSIIFDRFSQADELAAQQFGGAGLGLSISKGLVELLGGKIWVESIPGKGSNFFFTIPYKPDKSAQAAYNHTTAVSYRWQKKIVLLVEDDEYNSEYIKEALKETGIEVVAVTNGVEAINLVRNSKRFDLVLLDIRLPDIEGFKVAKQIKKYQPRLPIIAQTAYASDRHRIMCIEAGCTDYLAKPLQQEALLESIGRCLTISKP